MPIDGRDFECIRETLSYGEFDGIDFVVEAVVENPRSNRSYWPKLKRPRRRGHHHLKYIIVSITLLAEH